MKFFRYWWWLAAAFFRKHWRTLSAAMVLGILAVSAGIKYYQFILNFLGRETKVGMVGRVSAGNLPTQISGLISYGLTKTGAGGKPEPNLALGWEANADGTKYTFKIDTSKKWSDQTSVKASDLSISIENVETEILDDETIIFKLVDPYAPFPVLVSRPIFKKDFIGLGPDKVVRMKRNGEFIDELTLQKPDNQKVRFRFYRTSSDLITAFKLGEVDEVWGLSSLSPVPKWDEVKIYQTLNFDIYSAVFFNTADSDLADKSFRQSLVYAIPNKPTGDNRAISPINPLSFSYNPGVKPYETNPQLAGELLKEFLNGEEAPTLELTTTLPFLERAEEIARAWTQIGVKTNVKVATIIPENFQALLVGQERPADPDQYSLWHSTQKSNITHYSSPKVDKLLEDGRRTMDENKRLEIYRDFQRFLVEDSPAAFLEHLTTYNVKRK